MKKDLLTLLDLSPQDVMKVLARAGGLKKLRRQGKNLTTLKGKSLALIFEKPSTRTKVSFDVAMHELGGQTVFLETNSSQLGRGETYRDTAKVLSRYVHGIVIRTFGQRNLEEMAEAASIPVVNALSDLHHPCQVLADLLTVKEAKKDFSRLKITYVGDGNNIANSWITASLLLKFPLRIATPPGYEPDPEIRKMITHRGASPILLTHDPIEAVKGADVINTDTWFSMGQEVSAEKKRLFAPFQLNQKLLRHAKKDAIVLHCLPAHRGEEITDDVMDGPQSRIWDQAENRLHVQKAILEMFLK